MRCGFRRQKIFKILLKSACNHPSKIWISEGAEKLLGKETESPMSPKKEADIECPMSPDGWALKVL